MLISIFIVASCGEKKVYKIGISQCSSDDWRAKMNEEVMREAMLYNDVEIEIRSADDNSKKQIEDIEYFSQNGFDAIVVSPNEADALTPEIEKIHKAGIPVIIFDRNIHGNSFTQRIGVNNIDLGESAAEYANSLLQGKVKAIEIFGLPGSTPAEERSDGFKKELASLHGEVVASAPGNWQEPLARQVADSLLRLHPETNLIFAHNDRMAIGARKAAKALNRDDIKIIGIDAAPNIGIKAVSEGEITATFLYPTQGDLILREAINIVKGGKFDREVMLPTTSAVDSSNADILLLQNENMEDDTRKVLQLKDQLDDYVSLHNAQSALFYAIIAILVLLFGVLFLLLRTFWSHRRHQESLLAKNRQLAEERDKQKELNEKLELATQSKLVFYTNVSHDLRTPLTLIAEPVAQLKESENLDNHQQTLVKIADKNVKILQRLIDKILDFRKFELNKLKLSLSEVDFSKVLADWVESFTALARKRHIKLVLKDSGESLPVAIDVERMERVMFNLISNAFKYSPDNSTITVSCEVKDNNLIIKVADQGEGISKEDVTHIFDRFFQVDRVRPKGSGIGLALTKAFVELHGGTISVESELKKGSVFTISLPINHVSQEVTDVTKIFTQQDVAEEFIEVDTNREFSDDKPLLLVIDDNKDIREMLTELMSDEYNVLTAPNGKDGIRKASKYVPDLIVCDVMMPGIDGMECCARLKSETVTSHIPVLMLTACSLDEQRVQGFESGADGYLAKPFSSSVLKAQVASLIANRKRIKDLFNTSVAVAPVAKPASSASLATAGITPGLPSDIDNDFFNRFLALFEKKMGNPDLNVESMAVDLGFERTQLYRKIKAITNYSPVELMRNLRLKKARHLLKTTDKSVSEVCYEVGFSTPAYFTKCYREQYGETPSETKKI